MGGRRPSNFLSWISNEREFAPLSSHQRRDGRAKRSSRAGKKRRVKEGWHEGGEVWMERDGWSDHSGHGTRENAQNRASSPRFERHFSIPPIFPARSLFRSAPFRSFVRSFARSLVRSFVRSLDELFFVVFSTRFRIENAFQFGRGSRGTSRRGVARRPVIDCLYRDSILIHADSGRRLVFIECRASR